MSPWLFHWQCYDSARGGQAKLDADATKWAGLSKSRFIGEQRTYYDKHHGSRWGEHGVIPYHAMVVEPMHGCHMEFNVLMGESSHEHLLVVSNDKVVKDKIVEATREINELWGSVHTQQRYYFGRDSDGKPQPSPSVIVPDMKAGCSLADSAPAARVAAWKAAHPGAALVSYINCSAGVKAVSDIICTSSNAVRVIESLPADQPILFCPDKNLGAYLMKQTGRDMQLVRLGVTTTVSSPGSAGGVLESCAVGSTSALEAPVIAAALL